MAMKEHMRYKADTTPPRSRKQNISLCFLISISTVILKLMLKFTSISPRDLGESLRRSRRSAFIYHTFHQSVFYTQSAVRSPQSVFYTDHHTFIHTHNLRILHCYKVGDQASVEVEGVEEQMLIISSSLTPGRVKGFWIVLIWKIPACLKFGKTSILTVL